MCPRKGEGGAPGLTSIYDLCGRSRGHRRHSQKPQIIGKSSGPFIFQKPRKASERSLYVSLLGAIPGACVAGPQRPLERVRSGHWSNGQQMHSAVFSS